MKIMCRPANNDFEALLTADGMEDAGLNVFSITQNGMHQPHGAMVPVSKFLVWAKAEDEEAMAAADKAIAKQMRVLG